jgi:hypothetical protein
VRLARSQLLGAWELVRWEIIHDGGTRRTSPFGAGARGLLLYTPEGYMSASIMAAGRAPLTTANPRDAAPAERAAAFDGYFSYAGRYRVLGCEVRHEVMIALNPLQVGTLQARQARLVGRRLELSADEPLPDGHRRFHALHWRRARRNIPKSGRKARRI